MSLSVKHLYTKALDIVQRPGLLFLSDHRLYRYSKHSIGGATHSPLMSPTVWVYERLRPRRSMLAQYSDDHFLTQAVLDSHVQALSGVFTARFSHSTGDIEIDLIFDEEDESRPYLSD